MDTSREVLGFVQRFHEISSTRDTADSLIKDLLVYTESVENSLRNENISLKLQLQDQSLDYEDAVRSRRELQQHVQLLEAQRAERLLNSSNHHPKVGSSPIQRAPGSYDTHKSPLQNVNLNNYVVVLIDGDGLLFQDNFVRQGVLGGKLAAYALRSAILEQCGPHAKDVEVIAKVYVNLAGLCRAMRRDGAIENESDLKDFSLGFTQAKASFDFIDVGHGKERADNKIKEMTKWHLRNFNCKQVILGISHDAGYAPFLDEMFHDDEIRRTVTVLEGFPTVRELVSTNVNILNLNDRVFRSEKLVDRGWMDRSSTELPKPIGTGAPAPTPTPPLLSPAAIETKPPLLTTITSEITSISSRISTTSSPPVSTPATSALSTPTPVSAVPTTYAKAMKKSDPVPPAPVVVLPIQPKPPAPRTAVAVAQAQAAAAPKLPAWNPGPRGLDPPLQVSQAALDNIKKRKDHNKLCNNHYLRGPCSKGDSCHFEHKYKPTKEEQVAIAFLTRLNPCSEGQECHVEDCIYGHHCPSVQNGYCTHPYCKFVQEDHPPGTKFKYKSHDKSSSDRDRER
ncbi:hypothetical protein QBC35DRAFT_182171 [Podospora australis]|uniref:C3H1-type domain-containing protein n=1 Tax=Podospora australis TaxID=1536484 RepID=A0AAN6WYF2_9PEZI|nr:hypothetical protein QBC35DRAFT_182171 [Podospora australis]